MKITKQYLTQVIKEEVEAMLGEDPVQAAGASHRTVQAAIERYIDDPASWKIVKTDYVGMSKGDDSWGIRKTHYPNWKDEDFQAVIDALADIDAQALWDL